MESGINHHYNVTRRIVRSDVTCSNNFIAGSHCSPKLIYFMKLLKALAVLACVLLCVSANAQSRQIRGKITDSLKQPVPFASVTLKGLRVGVSSDAEGNFSIKALDG